TYIYTRLLVGRVSCVYLTEIWSGNKVNNDPAHNYVDIIEADNIRNRATQDGDTYPGASGNTSLDATTTPALLTWDGKDTGIAISDIRELGERLVMRTGGGQPDIETPATAEPTEIGPASFTAQWVAKEGAIGYWVKLYTTPESDALHTQAENNTATAVAYVTGTTSHTFSGLRPQQECAYTITADDGCYGSPESEKVWLTTADPTFDYFSPTIHEAEGVTSTSFTVGWDALEGATEYFLTVFYLDNDTPVTQSTGFDGGAEDMPQGWSCTSRASYGMASYSGASTPALRLSANGDELVAGTFDYGIKSLSFWHRGNGTTASETLYIATYADGKWTDIETRDIVTEKGGSTITVDIDDHDAEKVKIQFSRPAKGAVAIDDVTVTAFGRLLPVAVDSYTDFSTGSATSHTVTGLEPGREYFYYVTATDGSYTSRPSVQMAVTTAASSGVESIATPDSDNAVSLNGRELSSEVCFSVYNAAGAAIATHTHTFTIPATGLYIVLTQDGKALKIIAQ
ncbi:MAG: fibronectin type III domain-containing protein, partial [Muribaculaceae bacterium]|nr:fibronectin type III domain-containing protein [Muribaculaceae bacterium]